MADTRLSNKGKKYPQSFFGDFSFFRLLRFVFFSSLSILVVYMYFLYLKGNLQKTILDIWSNHQKVITTLSIFILYSVTIFQLGVWRGRRK